MHNLWGSYVLLDHISTNITLFIWSLDRDHRLGRTPLLMSYLIGKICLDLSSLSGIHVSLELRNLEWPSDCTKTPQGSPGKMEGSHIET